MPKISEEEQPYSIPTSWQWVRFGSVAQHNTGKTLDKARNTGKSREYITTSNLYWGFFNLNNVKNMLIRDEELERCSLSKGDLLICEGGEAGRSAIWNYEKEMCFQNHIHRVRFFCNINQYYAYRFFQCINSTGEIEKYKKGVGINSISSNVLSNIPIPLPPLAEQKRIVSKVDELMLLCDTLEKQLADKAKISELFASAAVEI